MVGPGDDLMQGREHLEAVVNPQREGVRALEEALELIPGPSGEEDLLGQAPAGTKHVADIKERTPTTLYNARPAR